MERERLSQLPRLREKIGKPLQGEALFILNRFEGKFVRWKKPFSPEEKVENLEKLRLVKTEHEQNEFLPSRVALCVVYLFSLRDHFLNQAIEMLDTNEVELFRFYYDYSVGIGSVAGQINDAENKDHSMTDEHIAKYIAQEAQIFDLQRSASEDAEVYLEIKSRVAKDAKLLKIDPTGFLLIDKIIQGIPKGEDSRGTNVSPKYALAGARHAEFLYKQFYEIVGSLYPEQS